MAIREGAINGHSCTRYLCDGEHFSLVCFKCSGGDDNLFSWHPVHRLNQSQLVTARVYCCLQECPGRRPWPASENQLTKHTNGLGANDRTIIRKTINRCCLVTMEDNVCPVLERCFWESNNKATQFQYQDEVSLKSMIHFIRQFQASKHRYSPKLRYRYINNNVQTSIDEDIFVFLRQSTIWPCRTIRPEEGDIRSSRGNRSGRFWRRRRNTVRVKAPEGVKMNSKCSWTSVRSLYKVINVVGSCIGEPITIVS